MDRDSYKDYIVLEADGRITYNGWLNTAHSSKTKWNRGQCFKNINCGAADANEEANEMTMATPMDTNAMAVYLFAIIGLVFLLLFAFRRILNTVKPSSSAVKTTFTEVPTETTALDTMPCSVTASVL
jgi:hypothetical protein